MDVFSELKKFDFKHNDYLFSDLSYTKNNIDSEFKRMLDVVNNKI